MTDPHQEISLSTSSLDSYEHLFNKNLQNFTTSSEISFVNCDNERFEQNNRTFTKDVATTIINIFTGKPISPNPWRKLCTKNNEPNIIDPNELFSSDLTRNMINNQQVIGNTEDDDQIFEKTVQEPEILHQTNSPLQHRRKKRNSLKNVIDNASSSSDEDIKEHPSEFHPKINRSNDNQASWYRLADVYTSDSSDDDNLLQSNITYSLRLKDEIYTSDQSSNSTSSSTTDDTKSYFNFLESLSERIPMENKHPDAQSYFIQPGFQLKEKREELANKLLSIFNRDVFSSQLSDKVSVVWSGRLTATAGHCTSRRNTRTAVITLSVKVCDTPERCRDTLLHEMCHTGVTLIDGVMEHGHGTLWRKWTRIAEQVYPYLPSISVRHTYDINYRFVYRCIKCQYEVYRHSKLVNAAVDFCGKCMGKFELIINNKDDVDQEQQTPKKTINKYNLYVKENFQILKQANPHLTTPQLMKQLSQEYKQKNQQQQEHLDLPDLDKLKI